MRNKKKDKIIVGTEVLLSCMIVGILRINATSANPPSSEVNYNKNSQTNVQGSINDLYGKVAYGDAKASEILSGKKALVGGKQIVGTYIVPTLASQTPGDATAEDVIEGKIAWVNGNKIIGKKKNIEVVSSEELQIGDVIFYLPDKVSYTVSNKSACSDDEVFSTFRYYASASDWPYYWRVSQKNFDGTVDIILDNQNSLCLYVQDQASIELLNEVAQNFQAKGITVRVRHAGYMKDDTDVVTKMKLNGWYASMGTDGYLQYSLNGELRSSYNGYPDSSFYILPIVTLRSDLKFRKSNDYGIDGVNSYYINY